MWYKCWKFKNPIFNSHFYSWVCWLIPSTFDSLFSTSEQLYFLLSPSLPNPIRLIFVGFWATESTLRTDNCIDLSLSSWVPLSPCLLTSISFLPLLFFMQLCEPLWWSLTVVNLFTINLEVLLPLLHSWRSLETIGRIKLKPRGRRLKPQTWENIKLLTTQNIKE